MVLAPLADPLSHLVKHTGIIHDHVLIVKESTAMESRPFAGGIDGKWPHIQLKNVPL